MDGFGWLPFLLAGLAFFFLGLDAIKDSLRGLASRSMRARAVAAVASPFRAALLGVTFGQNARVEGGAGGVLRVGDVVEQERIA